MENKGRKIMNLHNVPVKLVQNGMVHPFSLDDPSYLSKQDMNFLGCFMCVKMDHTSIK